MTVTRDQLHALIAKLPESGFEEAQQVIAEMIVFYSFAGGDYYPDTAEESRLVDLLKSGEGLPNLGDGIEQESEFFDKPIASFDVDVEIVSIERGKPLAIRDDDVLIDPDDPDDK